MNLIFDEVGHTYTDSNGNIIPSVTQILGKVYGTGLEDAPSYFVDRAAAKGTAIHKEIEAYLKEGKEGNTPEFKAWKRWYTPGTKFESEKVICGETPYGRFAGTADLWQDGWLNDWKTCKTSTKKQIKKWQMQLSMYAYPLRKMGYPVNEPLKIIHLVGDTFEVIHVDYLGDQFVEDTMKLYAEGAKPVEEHKELQTVSENELSTLEEMLFEMAAAEKIIEDMRAKIKEEMEQRGILNLTFGHVKMSYVAGTVRKSFDSTAFKKDHADLYKKYQKDTTVKPTVRITVD